MLLYIVSWPCKNSFCSVSAGLVAFKHPTWVTDILELLFLTFLMHTTFIKHIFRAATISVVI